MCFMYRNSESTPYNGISDVSNALISVVELIIVIERGLIAYNWQVLGHPSEAPWWIGSTENTEHFHRSAFIQLSTRGFTLWTTV